MMSLVDGCLSSPMRHRLSRKKSHPCEVRVANPNSVANSYHDEYDLALECNECLCICRPMWISPNGSPTQQCKHTSSLSQPL